MSAQDASPDANNGLVDEDLRNAVDDCCKRVVQDRARGNYVKPKRLRDRDRIQELFKSDDLDDRIECRRVRYALCQADYIEQWSEDTFRIDPEAFADE